MFDFHYFWFWVWLGAILVAFLIAWFNLSTWHCYVDEFDGRWHNRVWKKAKRPLASRLLWSMAWAVAGAAAGFVIVLIGDKIAWEHVKEPTSWSRPIENLGDGAGVQGRFFLGSGTIDTSPVYMYYLREPEGYRLYHAYANDTYITYTDGTPQMVVHFDKSGDTFWSRNLGYPDDLEEFRTYEFQVPAGSVKQNFNLDAQ